MYKIIIFLSIIFSYKTYSQGSELLYKERFTGPYLPGYKSIGENSYMFQVEMSQFKTSKKVSHNSDEVSLTGNEEFIERDIDFTIQYGLRRRLDLMTGLKYRMISSNSGQEELTKSGVESYKLGGKYAFLPKGRWDFAISGVYYHSAYTVNEFNSSTVPSNELALGDGASFFTALFHFGHFFSPSWSFVSEMGMSLWSQNQADEFPYKASIVKTSNNFSLQLGIVGVFSGANDEYSNNIDDKPVTGVQNTQKYNSINRSFLMAEIGVGFKVSEKGRVNFNFGRIIQAKSYDIGSVAKLSFSLFTDREVSNEKLKMMKFKQYRFESNVTKVSKRGFFLKIDSGKSSDVYENQLVDIFLSKGTDDELLVASGIVHRLGLNDSIIRVLKKYRSISLEKGFIVRGR